MNHTINQGFYYQHLNDSEQQLYIKLSEALANHVPKITYKAKSSCNIQKIIDALTLANPFIFHLHIPATTWTSIGNIYHAKLFYLYNKDEYEQKKIKIVHRIKSLIEQLIRPEMDDFHKLLAIHDSVIQKVIYDNTFDTCHTIEGFFLYKMAVCDGIAKALKVILDVLNIPCLVVRGVARNETGIENHAWNMVSINGRWYHFDLTWDLTLTKGSHNRMRYDYFNLSDVEISENHTAIETNLPSCADDIDNYFVRSKRVITNKEQLITLFRNNKNSDNIHFKLKISEHLVDMTDKLIGKVINEVFSSSCHNYSYTENDVQQLFYVRVNRSKAESIMEEVVIEAVITCPFCGCENECLERSSIIICRNCKKKYRIPIVLNIRDNSNRLVSKVVVIPKAQISSRHFRSDLISVQEKMYGEIVTNPSNPDVLGIKNVSNDDWKFYKESGDPILIKPNRSVSALIGNKIDFQNGYIGTFEGGRF